MVEKKEPAWSGEGNNQSPVHGEGKTPGEWEVKREWISWSSEGGKKWEKESWRPISAFSSTNIYCFPPLWEEL